MLVLSRKVDEWIDIGDDIKICVVRITDERVRLGIVAPLDVRVNRREITERIRTLSQDEEKGS